VADALETGIESFAMSNTKMKHLSSRVFLAVLLILVSTATLSIAHPGSGIVVDQRGYVYFVDTGGGVWMVDLAGKLTRRDSARFHWLAIDESKQPFGARLPAIPGGEVRAVGLDPTLLVSSDVPLVIGRDGALYYPEFGPDKNLRIVRFTRSGVRSILTTVPSKDGSLRWLNGLAAGSDGSLYYTEDKAVRKVDERGVVSTVAASVTVPNCTRIPGNPETLLRGLAVAHDGSVFVAASGCGAVLKITPRGVIKTVLRTTSPWSPTAVAVSPSGVYVLEYWHTEAEDRQAWVPRVRKILPSGRIVSIAAVERSKAR
jgi:DNA-binding beta-propeller fold protein YncE